MLTSCTVIFPVVSMQKSAKNKVTHANVMRQYSNKNNVLNAFGMPTAKDNISGKLSDKDDSAGYNEQTRELLDALIEESVE